MNLSARECHSAVGKRVPSIKCLYEKGNSFLVDGKVESEMTKNIYKRQ